jgi:phosphoribosylamine--glycine ligase
VVIEECLVGEEVSLFALCDGETALPLGAAQDHKRVGEGETGPNTGGMGAYSPTPSFPPALQDAAMDGIIRPALAEMARRGTPFRGILYAGLMLTAEGAKLIEFNVRFGDPECQALLPRLMSDLLPALQAAYDGELENFDLRWNNLASIALVMAARGYPEAPESGSEIRGLDRAAAVPDVQIFHAGTEADAQGHVRAAGGRVLNVCATGADLRAAHDAAYTAIGLIDWPEGFCRHDIGWRALSGRMSQTGAGG